MSPDAGTNVVDVYINYLRKKLSADEDVEEGYCVIETVRGEGYQMGNTRKLSQRVEGFSRRSVFASA